MYYVPHYLLILDALKLLNILDIYEIESRAAHGRPYSFEDV